MKNRIEEQWLSYAQEVLPAGCSEVQLRECRAAFYGGAAAFYAIVMTGLDDTDGASDADIDLMQALHQELEAYGAQAAGGRL